jgi:hypothetical protein
MEDAQGGVLTHFTHNCDPFVALTYAAAATQTLRLGNRRLPGAPTRADRAGQALASLAAGVRACRAQQVRGRSERYYTLSAKRVSPP